MKVFSERLKQLRKSQKLKQSDIAELLGITVRHYQEVEYGHIDIPSSKLILLADYFNVSLDYLVGRSDCPDIVTKDKDGNYISVEAMRPNSDK